MLKQPVALSLNNTPRDQRVLRFDSNTKDQDSHLNGYFPKRIVHKRKIQIQYILEQHDIKKSQSIDLGILQSEEIHSTFNQFNINSKTSITTNKKPSQFTSDKIISKVSLGRRNSCCCQNCGKQTQQQKSLNSLFPQFYLISEIRNRKKFDQIERVTNQQNQTFQENLTRETKVNSINTISDLISMKTDGDDQDRRDSISENQILLSNSKLVKSNSSIFLKEKLATNQHTQIQIVQREEKIDSYIETEKQRQSFIISNERTEEKETKIQKKYISFSQHQQYNPNTPKKNIHSPQSALDSYYGTQNRIFPVYAHQKLFSDILERVTQISDLSKKNPNFQKNLIPAMSANLHSTNKSQQNNYELYNQSNLNLRHMDQESNKKFADKIEPLEKFKIKIPKINLRQQSPTSNDDEKQREPMTSTIRGTKSSDEGIRSAYSLGKQINATKTASANLQSVALKIPPQIGLLSDNYSLTQRNKDQKSLEQFKNSFSMLPLVYNMNSFSENRNTISLSLLKSQTPQKKIIFNQQLIKQ